MPQAITTRAERVSARTLVLVPMAVVTCFFGWPLWSILRRGLSWSALAEVAGNGRVRGILWFTLWQAALSTALTVVVGIAPAVVLARSAVRGANLIRVVSTVPFVLPTVVTGTAFLALLPSSWERSLPAILLAHVWVNLAVVVRVVGTAIERVDPRMEDAAAVLGAPRWQQLRCVTLPMVRAAIGGAAGIVFLFCSTSFGIVRLLGTERHSTVEVEIWRRIAGTLDLSVATALSAVQFVVVAALAGWASWRRTRRQGSVTRPVDAGERRAASTVAVAVTVATGAVVAAPIAALAAASLRVAGSWSLGGWRALATTGQPSGARVLADPLSSLAVSASTAAVAAALAVVLGACAATGIQRVRRGRAVAEAVFVVPLGVSAVTVGLGLVVTFSRGALDLRGSWIMLPIGQSLIGLPFVLRILLDALRSIPSDQFAAAATLGASPPTVWRAIEWPVARRAAGVAFGFAAAVSLGEFGAASVLSRSGRESAPVAIGKLLGRPAPLNLTMAAALSVLLAAIVAMVTAAAEWAGRSRRALG